MAKRKRVHNVGADNDHVSVKKSKPATASDTTCIQIVTGSYERTLHGITAQIPNHIFNAPAPTTKPDDVTTTKFNITFADTFLFNAHASAIRCLALSPPSDPADPSTTGPQKRILASGSTDEKINLYHLSTAPPPTIHPSTGKNGLAAKPTPSLPSLSGTPISQNPRNRELGSLIHHSGTITTLHFASRSKFLSAATDNTIAISRTRDWTVLSSIKAPIPKPQGRPSGDTLSPGEVPAGVNDFAVHPSNKLMVSVGKAEKCMRLWNLVTGKKAGVLQFGRKLLEAVGEGRYSTGEGRRVVWDQEGEEFAVGFERGVVVYGMDCKPRARVMPEPRTKIHQIHYLPTPSASATGNILVVSTEDGRLLFYSTSQTEPASVPEPSGSAVDETTDSEPKTANGNGRPSDADDTAPLCILLGTIGGLTLGLAGRIKDFELLPLGNGSMLIVTGSSDGAIRLWTVDSSSLISSSGDDNATSTTTSTNGTSKDGRKSKTGAEESAEDILEAPSSKPASRQIGTLLGTYEAGNRIMCLKAFELTGDAETLVNDSQDHEDEEEGGRRRSGNLTGTEDETSDDDDNDDH